MIAGFSNQTFPPPSQELYEQHRHQWVKISNRGNTRLAASLPDI
jgi:hypothetical protein